MDSAGNIADQPNQLTINYYHIQLDGTSYRVASSNYDQKMLILGLGCIAQTGVILVCIMMMLVDIINSIIPKFQMNSLMPLVGIAMSLLALTVIILLKRKKLKPTLIFSSITTFLYTTCASILYASNAQYQWIAALCFVSVIIIIGLFFYINKKNIILVLLLGLQLILVGLKLDNIVSVPWATLLLILIAFGVISLLLGLAMLFYGIAQRIRLGRHTLSSIGPFYQALIQIGIALDIIVVITRLTILSSSIYLGSVCIVFHLLFILLFCNHYKTEIILYLSKGIVMHEQERKMIFAKIEQEMTLYKLSSNWFGLKDKLQKSQQNQMTDINISDTLKINNYDDLCVVCLTDKSSLVWMPCGHMAVCDNCGKFLMERSKEKCVICKTRCEKICHLAVKQPSSVNPRQYKSDFCFQTNFQ